MIDSSSVAGSGGYMLYHSIGIYPGKEEELKNELADFAEHWCALDHSQWTYAARVWEEFRHLWRNLINAPDGTLTTTENVTAALYSFIGALPSDWLTGKRVLIDADCFPSMHFLLSRLSERMNFTLETVGIRQGENYVLEDDIIDKWDDDVALAVLTWVTSVTSRRYDIHRLAAHAREKGTLLGFDTTQAVGIVPYDVLDPEVDFMIGSSLKWLCGVPGAGVLYVRKDLIPRCRPEFCGWFSHANPFNWKLDEFEYAPDAQRFGQGTPSVAPYAASLPGLRWHAKTGIDALRADNVRWTERLLEVGVDAGWDILTPIDKRRRGGSVMIRLPDAVEPQTIIDRLSQHRCFADNRSQTIRLSPGALTTEEGIETAIHVLDDCAIAA